MKFPAFFLVLLSLLLQNEAARILTAIPTVTKSHYTAGRRIFLELARRGHEVVMITPYEEKDPPPNFTWIPVEIKSFFDAAPELRDDINTKLDCVGTQNRLYGFMKKYTKYILERPKLRHFIDTDKSHFDLVIVEEFFQDALYAFAHKYKAPLVLLSTFGAGHYINEYMGNSLELSYAPHEFVELYGDLDFFARAKNMFCTGYDLVGRRLFFMPTQNEIAKAVFKDDSLPALEDLARNASLILLNAHFSLSVVRPYLPNMIEVAGNHIEETKPLPKDIKDILDKSKQGAILFSFGSMLELTAQTDEFVHDVLTALGKMPQTVLVKWDVDVKPMPLVYNNIYPFKWLPQNDILAHPNLKAFVTHGGLHSALETITHGVPIVCIPFYGDQPLNCLKSVKMGYGIHISNLTSTVLHQSLVKIISEQSYRETAQDLSRRFNDRPLTPLENGIFHIEYVIRHKGADFMKSPKRKLYWYQTVFLDVLLVVLLAFWVVFKSVKVLLSFVCKSKVVEKSEKSRRKKRD